MTERSKLYPWLSAVAGVGAAVILTDCQNIGGWGQMTVKSVVVLCLLFVTSAAVVGLVIHHVIGLAVSFCRSDKEENPSAALLVCQPELQRPTARKRDTLVLASAWGLFLYLLQRFVTMIPWFLCARLVSDNRVAPAMVTGAEDVLLIIFLFAAMMFFTMLAWANWNYWRFGRLERRKPRPPVPLAVMAGYFGLDEAAVRQAQDMKVAWISVGEAGPVLQMQKKL